MRSENRRHRLNLFANILTKGVLATPEYESDSDECLVARINEGDEAAFETLYRRHRDWVAGLAFRLVGDHGLAMDVLQETFLYVLRKFPGFHLTCQFRSFLYPAVRNLAIAARKKAGRAQDSGSLDLPSLEAPATKDDSGVDRTHLTAVLALLSEVQREVLLLRFVDGMSLKEIAEALGVPTGTVKSRLHNALATLRSDERTRDFFRE
jgi:RNA polymerase sigma-70 factor (ECF subfamily)